MRGIEIAPNPLSMSKTLKRILSIAISLIFIGWLLQGERIGHFLQALNYFTPSMILIATTGFTISYLLRALRVYDEFRHDIQGRFGTCLRIVLMHNAMVNIVPFRGGEAAFPLLLQKHFNTPLPRAIGSLLWFRLQDAVVVGLAAILLWPGLPIELRTAGVIGMLVSIGLLKHWARAPLPPSDTLPAKQNKNYLLKLRTALGDSITHARLGWVWTFANWFIKLLTQAWLLAALLNSQLTTGISGALGAELAAILPVQGVAGFGTYEAGAAAALLPSGINFTAGLQAALALHLFVIGCAVSAGILAALWPDTKPAPPASVSAPPSANTANPDSPSSP